MRAFEITQRAGELVARDRHDQHGEMLANHQAIADIWNGYLRAASISIHDLTAADVANMMELLKVARRLNGAFNPDDYVDGAGYAAIAGEIAFRLPKTDAPSANTVEDAAPAMLAVLNEILLRNMQLGCTELEDVLDRAEAIVSKLNEPSASAKPSVPHQGLPQESILVVSSLPLCDGAFRETQPHNAPVVSH